jgi:hypothetical protein
MEVSRFDGLFSGHWNLAERARVKYLAKPASVNR